MQISRRISSAFKDIPGGQFLGPTRDYTKRLIDFKLLQERKKHIQEFMSDYLPEKGKNKTPTTFPKVVDLLRQEGLINISEPESIQQTSVDDLTRESLRFPASRAIKLQAMARGETGSMMLLAYSSMRGYGAVHPCLGELRVGYVDLQVPHPLIEGETITVGKVLVTEAEIIARIKNEGKESNAQFSVGYGLCFGHNEVKAIAMGTLDRTMKAVNPQAPAEDEEFVLYHIDGIEASGFVSHWKLPHYVDFQADLNRVRSIREREDHSDGHI